MTDDVKGEAWLVIQPQHTPGPWRFREFAQDADKIAQLKEVGMMPTRALTNEGGAYVVASETRIAIVDVQSEYKRGKGHESDCAERDANARLIAAAPEMFAALVPLAFFNGKPGSVADMERLGTLFADARAAIAAATGAQITSGDEQQDEAEFVKSSHFGG